MCTEPHAIAWAKIYPSFFTLKYPVSRVFFTRSGAVLLLLCVSSTRYSLGQNISRLQYTSIPGLLQGGVWYCVSSTAIAWVRVYFEVSRFRFTIPRVFFRGPVPDYRIVCIEHVRRAWILLRYPSLEVQTVIFDSTVSVR